MYGRICMKWKDKGNDVIILSQNIKEIEKIQIILVEEHNNDILNSEQWSFCSFIAVTFSNFFFHCAATYSECPWRRKVVINIT